QKEGQGHRDQAATESREEKSAPVEHHCFEYSCDALFYGPRRGRARSPYAVRLAIGRAGCFKGHPGVCDSSSAGDAGRQFRSPEIPQPASVEPSCLTNKLFRGTVLRSVAYTGMERYLGLRTPMKKILL